MGNIFNVALCCFIPKTKRYYHHYTISKKIENTKKYKFKKQKFFKDNEYLSFNIFNKSTNNDNIKVI